MPPNETSTRTRRVVTDFLDALERGDGTALRATLSRGPFSFEGPVDRFDDAAAFAEDIERYALLPELGWTDIRVTSGMLHNAPRRFLERVGSALIARGCARTW